MTRGRETNHAYILIEDNQTAGDVLGLAISREWIDQPAVTRQIELTRDQDRTLPHSEQTLGKPIIPPGPVDRGASRRPRDRPSLSLER